MEENTLFPSLKQITDEQTRHLQVITGPTRQKVLAEEGRATLV